jgi:hypothetical protein
MVGIICPPGPGRNRVNKTAKNCGDVSQVSLLDMLQQSCMGKGVSKISERSLLWMVP